MNNRESSLLNNRLQSLKRELGQVLRLKKEHRRNVSGLQSQINTIKRWINE